MVKKKNAKDIRLRTITELANLHNKVGYKNDEMDENIIQTISDQSIDSIEIKALKVDMWLEYTRLLLENVSTLMTTLLENFVAVESVQGFNKKFVLLQQRYEKLQPKNQNVELIKILFNDVYSLYEEIRVNEIVLKKSGRDRFLVKIYPTYVTIFSVAYWGLFLLVANQQTKLENSLLFGIVGWIIVLSVLYFSIKWIFRRGLKRRR